MSAENKMSLREFVEIFDKVSEAKSFLRYYQSFDNVNVAHESLLDANREIHELSIVSLTKKRFVIEEIQKPDYRIKQYTFYDFDNVYIVLN